MRWGEVSKVRCIPDEGSGWLEKCFHCCCNFGKRQHPSRCQFSSNPKEMSVEKILYHPLTPHQALILNWIGNAIEATAYSCSYLFYFSFFFYPLQSLGWISSRFCDGYKSKARDPSPSIHNYSLYFLSLLDSKPCWELVCLSIYLERWLVLLLLLILGCIYPSILSPS